MKLANMIPLSHSIKVYVPSTVYNKKTDTSEYVSRFGGLFSDLFGGATVSDAFGYYRANNGELITESVKLVYAFAETLSSESLETVLSAVNEMKKTLCQECISVEIDNQLYFV